MIQIDAVGSAKEIDATRLKGAVAVVIDVLRATSVMVTAFENGVRAVIAVSSPEAAFTLKKEHPQYLLGGEKDALYIPGFDFDNSCYNYTRSKVEGHTLVMSTSNGTRAINGSLSADRLLIGSFLNAKSVVDVIKEAEKVVFVCSGSNNSYTLEDSLCAGYMIEMLTRIHPQAQLSDMALSMMVLYPSAVSDIHALASRGNHYQVLVQKGFQTDLDYCFGHDIISLVPELIDGVIVVKR